MWLWLGHRYHSKSLPSALLSRSWIGWFKTAIETFFLSTCIFHLRCGCLDSPRAVRHPEEHFSGQGEGSKHLPSSNWNNRTARHPLLCFCCMLVCDYPSLGNVSLLQSWPASYLGVLSSGHQDAGGEQGAFDLSRAQQLLYLLLTSLLEIRCRQNETKQLLSVWESRGAER